MKKLLTIFISILCFVCAIALCACEDEPTPNNPTGGSDGNQPTQTQLGGLSPEDALEYMKKTEDLVIVDVATFSHYRNKHFDGAINIPIEELSDAEEEQRFKQIPSGKPVILHCRRGVIVPSAYRKVIELRPDIPEISYITGAPMFDEYNNWKNPQTTDPDLPIAPDDNDDDKPTQTQLGGLSPEDALEYMKKTEDLVIVDVATSSHYRNKHFDGAINIPIEELSDAEEEERFKQIPSGKPVILHCRRGVIVPSAYRKVIELRPDIPEISYITGAPMFDEYNNWKNPQTSQKLLGGLSPSAALEYLKTTPNVVIVQVNTAQWKIEPGFTGAMWIPHDEMEKRYNEIPKGVPVMLHCGGGIVSVPAYEVLIKNRPDIPELSYIAGSPHSIISQYNEWVKTQQR